MKKRALSLLLAVLMAVSLLTTATLADVTAIFDDVTPTDWFFSDVDQAMALGLINGKGNNRFAPNDNLTYAEAVKLAAAMHQRSETGSVTLTNGNPWYQTYVDYAKAKGIISRDYDWNANATRAGYMEIFAKALPDSKLVAINSVADGSIPDVPATYPQAAAIYKLYRAGIVEGADTTTRACKPNDPIRRCEVAAILVRMMLPANRKSFKLGDAYETLRITKQPENVTVGVGATATFNVAVFGGQTPYTYDWQARRVTESSWGSLAASLNGKSYLNYLVQAFLFQGSGYEFRCVITDATGVSITSNVVKILPNTTVLNAKLANATLTQANSGVNVSTTVNVSGGVQPYTYQWYWGNTAGDWFNLSGTWSGVSNTNTISYTPGAVGNRWYLRCRVTDAAGNVVDSDTCTVSVTNASNLAAALDKTAVAATPGSQVSLTATVTGGRAPFTFQWFSRTGTAGSWTSTSTSSSYTTSTVNVTHGTANSAANLVTQVYCRVTDATGAAVDTQICTISSGTLTASITGSATTAYGRTVTLSSSVAGGTQPYSYQWSFSTDGKTWYQGANNGGTSYVYYPYSSPAYQYVKLTVTDRLGVKVDSNICTITVTGASTALTAEIPTAYSVQAGKSLSISSSVTGGSAPYSYQWQYSMDNRNWTNGPANVATYNYLPAAAPNLQYVRLVIRDAANNTVTSNTCVITVMSGSLLDNLTITQFPTSPTVAVGDRYTLAVTVAGGTTPYTYRWQYRTGNGAWRDAQNVYSSNANSSSLSGTAIASDFSNQLEFQCIISDAKGVTVYTGAVKLTQKSGGGSSGTTGLTVRLPESYNLAAGATQRIIATVDGGSVYGYVWYVDGQRISNANYYYDFSNNVPGTNHSVVVQVLDASRQYISSNTCYITIHSDFSVTLDGGQNTASYGVTAGYQVSCNAQAWGAEGNVTFEWLLDGQTAASGVSERTFTYTFREAGTHTLVCRATDTLGRTATATATIVVRAAGNGKN